MTEDIKRKILKKLKGKDFQRGSNCWISAICLNIFNNVKFLFFKSFLHMPQNDLVETGKFFV
jgi:hypothetical protein